MKRILWIVALCSLLLIGAGKGQGKLVRLTIINKSGMDLEIRLIGQIEEEFYNLKVPAGDRIVPTEKVFTIIPDVYSIQPIYVETWDPVYGFSCGGAVGKVMYATHNIRITILECGFIPRYKGAPTMVKYSPRWKFIY